MPTRTPHRFPSLRLSTFTALLAIVALALGIALLRDGGSAQEPAGDDSTATLGTVSARQASTSESASQVYSATHRGVVKITTGSGLGTGIVLDKSGDILTNDHVVDGSSRVKVSFDSNTTRSARVLGTDPSDDLAVVKIDPSGLNLQPLRLADSNTVKVGDTVYALGNPFGYTNSFSEGIVSGLDRTMTAPNGFTITHAIQTDAAINPGNSGGPLLNANGEVIGINAQIASNGSTITGQGQNNGVGFAIPIDTAKNVVRQLETSGHVSHAYLGVASSDASNGNGAVVQQVQPGSPAAAAGINQGDVIRSVNGRRVTSSSDLVTAISSLRSGDKARLVVTSGGSSRTVTITLGQQPSQAPNG
ncbi:MAG TPA: trypsin-like peptidase domain-containing protein [Thermoleophilaceae bacterium]|nr:trypsin-like peptidase domain-containing protein [Thermoleophilaceae bacterium]